MKRTDLISEMSRITGQSKTTSSVALDGLICALKNFMEDGEPTTIKGFGTFSIKTRKEKVGRNITKGTSVIIPARRVPHFKFSPLFVSKDID